MESNEQADNSYEQNDIQQAKVDEYWTDERMRNAIPVETPALSDEETQRLIQDRKSDKTPGVQILPASGPSPKAETQTTDGEPYGVDETVFPYSSSGKWFFTANDGRDYIGSAAFVGDKTTLLTAGHCVRDLDTGVWHHNFLFVQGYANRNGKLTGKRVEVNRLGCYARVVGRHHQYDYAFCKTTSDSDTGWFGFATSIPYPKLTALGYPSNYGDSEEMYAVNGSKGAQADGVVQMLANPMGPGCSGGPWVGDLKLAQDTQKNIACGLNSFSFTNDPASEYSPYFDSDTMHMFECIRDNNPV
jgi:V8-like Glu-specific endopeptidase